MSNKAVIVFSGFNQRAVIGFLRVLKSNKVSYAIIAVSDMDPIFLTGYKNRIMAVRKSIPLVLDDILECLSELMVKVKAEEYIIAPSSEALNRFLLQNQLSLERINCFIPLVNKKLYELISDKESFGMLCHKNGILTPCEFNENDSITLPIVAKPKKYFSSVTNETLSPVIIQNSLEFEVFKKKFLPDDYYYQEYVIGLSYYLLYYFHRNGKVFKFSQENYIQQPGGKSIVAAISSTFHLASESEKYEKLFRSLNYFGLVMVEVKQVGEDCYMIEANPRFWGPSQLFIDASMNFFEAFLHDFGILEAPPRFIEPVKKFKYFWFGGIMESFKKKMALTYYKSDEDKLIKELPVWLQSDIYRRKDTFTIFKNEIL